MSLPKDYYRNTVGKYFDVQRASVPTYQPLQQSAPVTPAVAVEEKPEKKKDKGTVDKLFGGIGKTFDLAGDFLGLSEKYLANPILGGASRLMASDAVQGGFDKIGVESLTEDEQKRIQGADSYTQAWREREKTTEWWESMVAQIIADPTTWITAGTVGTIAKLPKIAKAAEASPKLAMALKRAEDAVGLGERIQALPLTAPFAGIKGAANIRKVGSGVFDPVTGEELRKGLFQQAPRSVLAERTSEIGDALENTLNKGATTRGAAERGQFGFSSAAGATGLEGSRTIEGARRTAADLGTKTYGEIRASLRGMGNPELADLYKSLPETDPLFPHVEAQMINKGLLSKTTVPGGPGQFTQATTTSVNDAAIDASRIARDRMLNTPGIQGAMPKMTGDTPVDVNNMLRFVKHEAGLGANATPTVQPFIEKNLETVIERNKGRIDAGALFAHKEVRADLAAAIAAPTEREAARHLEMAFYRINAKQSSRGVMHPWGAKIVDKYIPMIDKTKDNINIPALNRYAVKNSVVDDKQMRGLEKMFEDGNVITKQKAWEKDGDKIAEIFNRTPGAGTFTDKTTIQDIKGIYHLLSKQDQQWVDAYRKRWKIDDASFEGSQSIANKLSKTSKYRDVNTFSMSDAYASNMIDTWQRSQAKIMGISDKTSDAQFFGKFAWVPKAWREQALISPRYQLVNLMDMSVKSALHGVNGLENRGAAKTAEKLGIPLPRQVFVGRDTTDLSDIGEQFMSPGGKSALPGPLGWVSKMNRGVSRGMENSFREWAYDNGLKDVLQGAKPLLHQRIRTMSPTKADAIISELEQTGTYVSQAGKQINTKRDAGILFSPDDLHAIARKHGASTQQANDLARGWSDIIQQGSENGINMSNKVHFDFDKTYNIEDKLFLKQIMPFHFFATRNIPGYAQTLANRPEVVNAWMAYQDASEQDRIEMGLPDRLEGMVSIGDGFLDGLLGPNQVYFNPMSAISFVDQTKNFGQATRENEYSEPAKLLSRRGIGGVLDRTAQLGVGGPAPWIQIPLSIVGLTEEGAKDETMPILRHSGLAENYLGVDLGEGVARGFINDLRAAAHNGERVETHTGSQFRDNQIVTKLQESMQTLIDQGNDPTEVRNLLVQASKDGPGNQYWDAAAEEVRREQGERDKRNFWFPFPTKDTTEQGVRLSQARESKPEGLLDNDTVVDLLKHFGDPAVANRGFRRPGLVDRQGDPIIVDPDTGKRKTEADKKAEKDAWGGDNWGPSRSYPYNSPVIYKWWQEYKSSIPNPDDARVSDFFKAYKIPGR